MEAADYLAAHQTDSRFQYNSIHVTPRMTREEFDEKTRGWRIDLSYDEAQQAIQNHTWGSADYLWVAMKKEN